MARLSDIAARAGVSISTVRRVLYNLGAVRPETERRVKEALAALEYIPNSHARALVGARAPLVALVVPQMKWYVSNVLIVTLQRGIAALDLRSVFFLSDGNTVEQTVQEILHMSPRAVVLAAVPWFDEYSRIAQIGIPLVGVDLRPNFPPNAPVDQVGIDRVAGFRRATEHLLQLGHRRVGLFNYVGNQARVDGYEQAMQAAGLQFRAVVDADETGVRAPRLTQALEQLMANHPDLTGIVCSTDLWAQEIITLLGSMGRAVPGDISVAGYSNEPWTAWTEPSLTTIEQGTEQLCTVSLDIMVRRLEGSEEPWHRQMLQPQLIVRNSTAPVKQTDSNIAS